MQINKKLFTVAITALMLFSMIAAAAPAFAAIATAAASPATGVVGSKTTLVVTGASPGGQVQTYWENLAGTQIGNQTTFADSVGAVQISVTIPDAVAGLHSLIVKDVSTGATAGTTYTITPVITLSPLRGIPGDSVVVTGSGFGGTTTTSVKVANVTFNAVDITPKSAFQLISATGNFTFSIIVPTIAYGPYNVTASDNATTPNVSPLVSFTVGASITISPATGPSGTIVTVTGRGFTHTAGLDVAILIGAFTARNTSLIRTAADGTFTGTVVAPMQAANGNYTVTATDSAGTPISGSLATAQGFKYTGSAAIILTPTSSQPGAIVNFSGVNFTAIAGTVVTVNFGAITGAATFTTNSSGGFSGSFTIPNLPTATYAVTATDTNTLVATKNFQVAITLLSVSPSTGPTGTTVTVTGYGFTVGQTANVTMGVFLVVPTTTVGATLSTTFIVPTMPTGTYTVTATDATGLTASTTFTVNATSTLTVAPATAPATLTGVKLTVAGFAPTSVVAFYIQNSTYNAALTTTAVVNPANASGIATATFTVPSLALGAYTIVANETTFNMFNATAAFSIGTATFTITTGASTYQAGNTVTFNAQSTFQNALTINVFDSAGNVGAIAIAPTDLVLSGSVYVVPLNSPVNQFTLATDAATGTWTWNSTLAGTTRSGSFTVTAAASTSNVTNTDLNNKIVNLQGNITALQTSVTGLQTSVTAIQSSVGTSLSTTISSIQSSLSSIQSGIATISTPNLGPITASLSSITATLASVSGDTATIKSSVGDLTTSLTAIGATVTSLHGDTATIQTDLGTLSGTVTSVSNNVATIQTTLGTMQVSLDQVKSDVSSSKNATDSLSPLIIVAIVLALIAAIAAIASIVLMRRKIAG